MEPFSVALTLTRGKRKSKIILFFNQNLITKTKIDTLVLILTMFAKLELEPDIGVIIRAQGRALGN